MEYNKLYFWRSPDSTPKWLKQWPQIWMQWSFRALINISKSPIDNKLTCLWIFIFQIHMVTQLDSLIWVEVTFVKEITKQVASVLEHVWTFKSYCKNNKSFFNLALNWIQFLVSYILLWRLVCWTSPWSFKQSCSPHIVLQLLVRKFDPLQHEIVR